MLSGRTTRRVALVFTMLGAIMAGSAAPSVAADQFTVSGQLTTSTGVLHSAEVSVYDRWGERLAGDVMGPDGQYSLSFEPSEEGTEYNFAFNGRTVPDARFHASEFAFWRTDETVTGDRTLDVDGGEVPYTVHLEGDDGSPREADVYLTCDEELGGLGESEEGPLETVTRYVSSAAHGTGSVQLWALAPPVGENRCSLQVVPEDGSKEFQRFGIAADGPTEATVVIPDPVTLSGDVTTSQGPATRIHVRALSNETGFEVAEFYEEDSDGTYSMRLAPGSYDITVRGITDGDDHTHYFSDIEIDADTVLDGQMQTVPVKVHLVDEAGDPAEGSATVSCSRSGANFENPFFLTSTRAGTGLVTPHAFAFGEKPNEYCYIVNTIGGGPAGNEPLYFEPSPSGIELTLVEPTRLLMLGGPDQDGVSGDTEALAPNGGDGNSDGIPDNQQANVTSLPSNGSAPGGEDAFVTVAAPAGVSLVEVTTMDPEDAATPPPAGVSLPGGLVSFVLSGVPQGSDQTVSLFMGSTEGVNSYAKYDADTGIWTSLPDDRVDIGSGRVDITLTDGGPGDDDGLANGEIVDPGGMAIVQDQTGDTTAPVVTGAPTTSPNGQGWYRGNVRIDWSATDEGSGVATQPADTIVTSEGSAVTAESPQVCDEAPTPNCATGTVTGLKIDKTDPNLNIGGVSNDATYVLGAVPQPTCSASDSLSGLSAPCSGVRLGGNRNGVGQFTYAATAIDRAGNRRVKSVSYRVVYRFDGFAAPLNNPPAGTSVFRAGVTVPVALSLKQANGRVVTPVAKPLWATPVRGARTTLPVNETAGSGKPTTGTAFVWRNGRWEYAWSTKGLAKGYLYRIGVRLDDGTTRYLSIGLR